MGPKQDACTNTVNLHRNALSWTARHAHHVRQVTPLRTPSSSGKHTLTLDLDRRKVMTCDLRHSQTPTGRGM